MTTTVNGIDAYVTSVSGTATSYIRDAGLTEKESAFLTSAETTSNGLGGLQVANFGASIADGGDATGLTNDSTAYTATVKVDGVDKSISVVGSAAQTFTTLLAEINTDLGASATATLVGGNIQIESAAKTDNSSSVAITDGDLFATLTGFVSFDASVDNGLQATLVRQKWNDQSAWLHFEGFVEVYDTTDARFVIAGDFAVADTTSGMTKTELEDLVARVNVIQNRVRR